MECKAAERQRPDRLHDVPPHDHPRSDPRCFRDFPGGVRDRLSGESGLGQRRDGAGISVSGSVRGAAGPDIAYIAVLLAF